MTSHVKHLVIASLIAAVALVMTWKLIAHEQGLAHDKRVIAEEKLANDLAVAKVEAQTSAVAGADLQSKLSAQTAAVARLEGDLTRLRAELGLQRQKDQEMPPGALRERWQGFLSEGTISTQPQGLLADLPAAHATVTQLEELPVLREEKLKVEEVAAAKDETLASAQNLITATKAELSTCQRVQLDQAAVCSAQVRELKAKQRKRSIVYAVAAFVGGIILGRRY